MNASPVSRPFWRYELHAVERLSSDDYESLRKSGFRYLAEDYMYAVFDRLFKCWRLSFGLPTSHARSEVGWTKRVATFWAGHHEIAFDSLAKHLIFFTTTNGLIGMGLESMCVGDNVVLFHGTNDTMLLRSSMQDFTYEGLVYVHGLSDGELDDLLEYGEFEERSFTLF